MSADGNLYHYTSADGLLGMLGKPHNMGEIWLSQIQYMNDHSEWWYAFEMLLQKFREIESGQFPDLLPMVKLSFPQGVGPGIGVGSSWGPFQRTFVFSLSEEADLLSQWRGYTPNGGYSIGFSRSALYRLAQRNGLQLVKCVYARSEQVQIIDEIFSQAAEMIRSALIRPEFLAIRHGDSTSQENLVLESAHEFVQRSVGVLATYFKNDSFAEEREWRLVGTVAAGGTDPRERWRTRRDLILPYCAVPLDDHDGEWPIDEVIVGPGVDETLASHAIQFVRYGRPKVRLVRSTASTLRR